MFLRIFFTKLYNLSHFARISAATLIDPLNLDKATKHELTEQLLETLGITPTATPRQKGSQQKVVNALKILE